MLSKDLEFRKNYENLKSNFPSLSNNILIVITGETPDLSEDVAKQLSTFLKKEKDLFSFVFDAKNDPFFLQNGLLYLDTDELEDLSDNLARFQPFLASLSSDASLGNFFKILNRHLSQLQQLLSHGLDKDTHFYQIQLYSLYF